MLASLADAILQCPVCKRGGIVRSVGGACCDDQACGEVFPVIGGRPALVDFAESVVKREWLLRRYAASSSVRTSGRQWGRPPASR